MADKKINAGEILWLPNDEETSGLSGIRREALGHPVVVLSKGQKMTGVAEDRDIQILIITSFGKKRLEERFSISQKQQRADYLPIHRPPYTRYPHPDSGLILLLQITGNPNAPGSGGRVSYVHLTVPLYVGERHLAPLRDGRARLTERSLRYVVEKRVSEMCRRAGVPGVMVPAAKRAPKEVLGRPVRLDFVGIFVGMGIVFLGLVTASLRASVRAGSTAPAINSDAGIAASRSTSPPKPALTELQLVGRGLACIATVIGFLPQLLLRLSKVQPHLAEKPAPKSWAKVVAEPPSLPPKPANGDGNINVEHIRMACGCLLSLLYSLMVRIVIADGGRGSVTELLRVFVGRPVTRGGRT